MSGLCRSCGHEIYTIGVQCPRCGADDPTGSLSRNSRSRLLGLLAAAIALSICLGYWLSRPEGRRWVARAMYRPAPIIRAIWQRDAATVEKLLESGVDPNREYPRGQRALHIAVLAGNLEITKLLLEHGADVAARSRSGATPLLWAAGSGAPIWQPADVLAHVEITKLLLEHGADVNAAGKSGATPLHAAAMNGHVTIAEILLEHGARVDARDGSMNETPLHRAAGSGHTDVVKLLLEHGADLQARNRNGQTPLHMAAWHGHTEMAKLLVEHGADLGARDGTGHTPQQSAAFGRRPQLAALLLEKETAGTLHAAARAGNVARLREMLEDGGGVNTAISSGETPLHCAAQGGHSGACGALLEAGADTDARELVRGETPLHAAVREGHSECAELLLANGADVNAWNRAGQTPLDLSISQKDSTTEDLLRREGGRVAWEDTRMYPTPGPNRAEGAYPAAVGPRTLAGQTGDMPSKAGEIEEAVWAVFHGDAASLREALAEGLDANARVREDGATILQVAVQWNRGEFVDVLLSAGADVNARDHYGSTPLHDAVSRGNLGITKQLLEAGARADIVNRYGRTPRDSIIPGMPKSTALRELLDRHATAQQAAGE